MPPYVRYTDVILSLLLGQDKFVASELIPREVGYHYGVGHQASR